MALSRRDFLWFASMLTPLSTLYGKSVRLSLFPLIGSVTQHLFPDTKGFPREAVLAIPSFILSTLFHSRYDAEIRHFILKGFERLSFGTGGHFVLWSRERREDYLRQLEQEEEGKMWLKQLLILCFESLLSDPIYGGNQEALGWRMFQIEGGKPRPKVPYIYG